MSLEEFKFIYWMEYAHRMWGRLLGLVFAGPAVYFAAKGYINRPLANRLGLLFLMGGTQGLVGWWMVRSGLQVSLSGAGDHQARKVIKKFMNQQSDHCSGSRAEIRDSPGEPL